MSVYKWYIGLLLNVLSVIFKSIGVVRVPSKSWKKEANTGVPLLHFEHFSEAAINSLYCTPLFPLRFEVNIPCIIIILNVNKIDPSPLPLSLNVIPPPLLPFSWCITMKHSRVKTPLHHEFYSLHCAHYFMVTPRYFRFQINYPDLEL